MSDVILKTTDQATVPVYALSEAELEGHLASGSEFLRGFSTSNAFKAKAGQLLSVPGANGDDLVVVVGPDLGTSK